VNNGRVPLKRHMRLKGHFVKTGKKGTVKTYIIGMLLTTLCWFTTLITWLINMLNDNKARAHSGENEGKLAQSKKRLSISIFGGKK